MGLVYQDTGDLDKALELFNQAFDIDERIDDRLGQATQLGNMGGAYLSKGELDKSFDCYNDALDVYKHLGATSKAEAIRKQIETVKAKMRE
jgi:tetratricopeptide (TPR) repeat protein